MPEPKAVVRNTADPTQVKKGKETVEHRRREELADLAWVASAPAGRRVLWRFMAECKTYESIFDGHGSRMSYNSGRQDFGHFLMGEVTEADPKAMLTMMQEAGKIDANTVDPTPAGEDEPDA